MGRRGFGRGVPRYGNASRAALGAVGHGGQDIPIGRPSWRVWGDGDISAAADRYDMGNVSVYLYDTGKGRLSCPFLLYDHVHECVFGNVQKIVLIPPNIQVEERVGRAPVVRAEVSGVRFPI